MNRLCPSLAAVALFLAGLPVFAADAKENWDQYCAKCHAADGSGKCKMGLKLKVKDYTDPAVQAALTDDEMVKTTAEGSTKEGRELMKGFKDDLSEKEIKDLVAYIRSLKK